MQRSGGSFQNWKEFPRKKMGRLLTHALPQPTPQNQPFNPLPPTPTQPLPSPKITPTKIPTTIEIPTPISLAPKQT